jgi:hypothetical protein
VRGPQRLQYWEPTCNFFLQMQAQHQPHWAIDVMPRPNCYVLSLCESHPHSSDMFIHAKPQRSLFYLESPQLQWKNQWVQRVTGENMLSVRPGPSRATSIWWPCLWFLCIAYPSISSRLGSVRKEIILVYVCICLDSCTVSHLKLNNVKHTVLLCSWTLWAIYSDWAQ